MMLHGVGGGGRATTAGLFGVEVPLVVPKLEPKHPLNRLLKVPGIR